MRVTPELTDLVAFLVFAERDHDVMYGARRASDALRGLAQVLGWPDELLPQIRTAILGESFGTDQDRAKG